MVGHNVIATAMTGIKIQCKPNPAGLLDVNRIA
jgi:hypothetical protein